MSNNYLYNVIGVYVLVACCMFIALAGVFPTVDLLACVVGACVISFLSVWGTMILSFRPRGRVNLGFLAFPVAAKTEITIAQFQFSASVEMRRSAAPAPAI